MSPICLSLLLLLTDFCTVHFHMKGPNKAWSWALIFCTLFLPHIPKTWLQPLQGEPNPGLREPFLLARFIFWLVISPCIPLFSCIAHTQFTMPFINPWGSNAPPTALSATTTKSGSRQGGERDKYKQVEDILNAANYYQVLGINKNASVEEIRRAYIRVNNAVWESIQYRERIEYSSIQWYFAEKPSVPSG